MNSHFRKWTVLLVSVCLCAICTAAGCGQKSSSGTAKGISSSLSAVSQGSDSSKEAAISKVPAIEAVPESGTSSLLSSSAKNDAFQKKWEENPIDAAFQKDNQSAGSSRQMVKLYSDYANKWKNEIASAYDRLMTVSGNDAALKNEQNSWVSGQAEALQKIKNSVVSGGTGASVAIASKIMQFYRSRAQQIYSELYQYDPKFTFSGN
ncbi:MAG: hypothetical protein PHE09_07375 [Oscillospiraceae bacterium]|nr:hypothetical protein [Oscillospiraceae bacterium]